jgi:hypothetical protein
VRSYAQSCRPSNEPDSLSPSAWTN